MTIFGVVDMVPINWLKSLPPFQVPRSRRQRRAILSRRRRAGSAPVYSIQRLEDRTLLAAPNPLDLSSLDGTSGFRIDGTAAGDQSGFSVSSAGDVNGDGFEDLIVGALGADPNGSFSGSSYVVFGQSGGFTSVIDLSSLDGTNGFRLDGGAASDFSGRSVSGAGDVNGDGFGDLIIGADGADPFGQSSAGTSYVVFGRSSGFSSVINLSTLDGTTGFRILGVASGDLSGNSVSSAGDVNGDGYDDLIIGAQGVDSNGIDSGSSYVVFGRSSFTSVLDLFFASVLNGTTAFRLDGVASGDRSGDSVSSAGDVNGDGFDDLLIGAQRADPNGSSSGSSYVVFGKSGGFASVINLSSLDGTTGFRLDGVAAGDNAGISVSSAGDVNGDGFDDLLIGAQGADPNGSSSGSSYVVFGRSGGFASAIDLSSLNGTTGFRLDGVAASDDSGRSVSGAGDVNGDGFDDLIVGAIGAAPNGSFSGSSYVVFGKSGGFASVINLSSLDGTTGFRLDGVAASNHAGYSVSNAGDVNGDGFDDLIIGAIGAAPNGGYSGSSYVIFGGNFTGGAETQVGGDGGNSLTATQGSSIDILIGGRGDDFLTGDGGSDVLRGGAGDDSLYVPDIDFSLRRLQGGTGVDTFGLTGTGLRLDLAQIADNRITGVEQIDLGGGGNLLVVTPREVLRLSGTSNTLSVFGGANARVLPIGGQWAFQGTVNIGGINYNQYTSGAATLNVETLVTVMLDGVLSLSQLNGTIGFRLDGEAADDLSGRSVSSAGDVNGDGFDDLIVGAPEADPNTLTSAGSSYVVFGRSGGFTSAIDLSSLDGMTGFRLDGVAAFDDSGRSVSSAGDVNGDGFDDLHVGAPGADPNGVSSGSTYIVFGKSGGFVSVIDLSTLDGTTGFRIDGVSGNNNSGRSVSSAGDVNGDGFDDLIVGAPHVFGGSSYVVFGKSGGFASVINLSTLNGTTGFRLDGLELVDDSGRSVSGAGDVNGDGFDDLIVGARGADPNGISDAGSSYVVFGRSGGFASVIELSTLDGASGFRLDGVADLDFSGFSVSSAGDVNGDGFDDLIVGARGADPNGDYSGSSYVVFGKSGGFASVINLSTLNGTSGFRLDGVASVDHFGYSVSSAGDVNGDGFDDLIVGAFRADPNTNMDAGSSYLLLGRSGSFASVIDLSTLAGISGFRFDGVNVDDYSGASVSSAGDVNGDGFDDLIVGALRADPNTNTDAGSSYVFFGGNFTGGAETQVGGDAADTLTATQGANAVDVLIGGRGNDTLISDGGPDSLRGGEGDDLLVISDVNYHTSRRLVGGTGIDTLRLIGAGLTLDLTTIPDNRIIDVEQIDLTGAGASTLTLNAREVLNISSSSNTLLVRSNGDTVNIGSGWVQLADEIDSDGFVFEVFTQGAATLKITHGLMVTDLPTGNGADDVTIRRLGDSLQVFDNNAAALLRDVPMNYVREVQVTGAATEADRVVVDFAGGGFFSLPEGITLVGGSSGPDELEVIGTGSTNAELTSISGGLDAGILTTRQGIGETSIAFSGIGSVAVTGVLTMELSNEIDLGAETLDLQSTAFVQARSAITLGGGTLHLSGGGVTFDFGSLLTGTGSVDGRVTQRAGSLFSATGSLTLGDTASSAGFFTDGELYVNQHTVTLHDANEAVLGSLTVLGDSGVSGTLTAANGFLLEEGKNLNGQGTVNGEFHNDGDVSGSGTGIVFNDLVTGIGSANNVTYNGGFSPGHSPAEIFLRGTANLGASNTLFIELGGLTPGSQFDRLSSTGTVNVDGALDVTLINGFTPANGDSFEIIGANTVNGTFDMTNLPALPLGLEWDVVYSAEAVTLNVFALAALLSNAALNGGPPNPNRSGIGTLGLVFNLPVNVAGAGSLTLFNHTTGQPVDISSAALSDNGSPIVTWNLAQAEITLPDGRYTAEIIRSQVTTTVGGPLARTSAIEFHILRGDVSGDGRVNATDFVVVDANFDPLPGSTFRAGDANGGGLVNASDFVFVDANFNPILMPLLEFDFGDAPESGTSFPTTLAGDGARHVITGNTLFLGASRDAETDGQPDPTASGDGADEDGVVFTGSLITGTNVAMTITSSGTGFVNGWIDFNQDGDWDDPGEQVFPDEAVVAGANNLQIAVPAGATLGSTIARFRLTGTAGYSYFGLAPNGEVEDYQLTVTDSAPDTSISVDEASAEMALRPLPPWWLALADADGLGMFSARPFSVFSHPPSLFWTGRLPRLRGR